MRASAARAPERSPATAPRSALLAPAPAARASHVAGAGPSRRELLLSCSAPAPLVLALIGSDVDATTLFNSVLSGYGLPKLPSATGFKLLDELENDFTLE